jgi:membrane associated rhomboid family serine protease
VRPPPAPRHLLLDDGFMGLSDRDYARHGEPGLHLAAPQSATVQLVILTVGVYLLQVMFDDVTDLFRLKADWFLRPWEAYRLLTYGFLHAETIRHIIFNMLGLWLFGRELEQRYGKRRFVVYYLSAIVFSGLVWSGIEFAQGNRLASSIGASGGVTAVVILFAILYPHVQVLFMLLFPMPMWVLGLIIVAQDIHGAIQQSGNTAFTAHLAGAAFAFIFYKTGWLPGGAWLSGKGMRWRPRPKLRVHEPDEEEDDELSQKVDDILRKIQEKGQDSLSWSERRILERASREYKQKRH